MAVTLSAIALALSGGGFAPKAQEAGPAPAVQAEEPARTARSDRFFRPTEGFTRVDDLPADFSAEVRSIQLEIKDAFEGSAINSEAEALIFDVGNKLHIESRPGTIKRRLLFGEGDTVSKGLLVEAEKALRSEQFLADAILEVRKWEDGTAHVIVTTYDQWTTVPGFSIQRLGGEWIYWLGPVESNLLGTGQRLGFFIGHDQYRDTRWIDYANNALFPQRLRLASHLAWLSDGYSTLFSLSKPLESRASRYAFSVSWSATELSEFVYFDANRLDELPESLARRLEGGTSAMIEFDRVATHEVNLSATRSFGTHTKFNVSPTFDWKDRYNHGDRLRSAPIINAIPIHPSAFQVDERYDFLAGVSFSLYQYDYKTVRNFRNLKWSETLEVGWRLSTKLAQNQKWMGAENSDFYLNHSAVYNNAWWNALFLNSNASLRYFVSPDGEFDDGKASLYGETQWKPHPLTTTFLSASWAHLFAAERSQQLLLGEEIGLNGFPNAYFAGQARFLVEAEQRFFPRFEFGTVVPALALFGTAGNTFPTRDDFDADDLHYSLGVGLRLGASKSTQKVVNHFNLSWPIGEERLDGPVFSIRAKTSL
jgi:hypothetical protein